MIYKRYLPFISVYLEPKHSYSSPSHTITIIHYSFRALSSLAPALSSERNKGTLELCGVEAGAQTGYL